MAKKLINLVCILLIASFSAPPVMAQSPAQQGQAAVELAPHAPGEVLVKFAPWVNSVQAQEQLAALDLQVKRTVPALGVKLVKLPPGLSVEDALALISKRPGVEYVEPNYIFQLASLQETTADQWALTKVQAPAAWTTFSEAEKLPIVLAAVDTGVDDTHTDLFANIWSNPGETAGDGIDNDGNGFIDDTWGWDFVNDDNDPVDDNLHGTAVSSVMVGEDDEAGVTGVCPWCKVMAVKVMTDQGIGYLDVIANGITYAADWGAQVINLSLAGTAGSQVLEDAVNYAWNKDVLVVAGAGNDGANAPMYPAGYANAMAVAATGEDDTHACFSNYAQDYISVAAPGVNMKVALPGNQYGAGSGTSLSSPMVVGLAGLLLSQDENLSNSELQALIESTAVDLGPTGFDMAFGHGRIDALRAVSNDTTQVPPPDGLFSTNNTASGYAHARKLVRDSSGTLHLIWHTQDNSLYSIRYATSDDDGLSWIVQPDVYSSNLETYHSALAADEDYLYVAMPRRSAVDGPYQIMFSRKPISGGAWSPAVALTDGTADAVRPDLYVDPTNGRLHLLASSLDNAPLLYYRSSNDQGSSWTSVVQVNPSAGTASAGANTRYATIHANGDNLYIATKTMSSLIIFTNFYLHTVRSTDGGLNWFDQTQIASFQALTSGDYGLALAGQGDRLYMVYELFTNIYFRRFDNGSWSNYLELETGSGEDLYRWPTITQAPDGTAWMIFEANGQLYMREYDGSTWAPKTALETGGSYANLKLGTSGNKVEWISTQCGGAPFTLVYDSLSLGANNPPTADDQVVATDEDSALPITLTGSDPDSDPLTFSITGGPSNGSLTGTPPDVTYQPVADFNGGDSFTFVASDGSANSNTATVSITVNPVNDAPTADDDSVVVMEDTPQAITLSGGDVDGDPITFAIAIYPMHGILIGAPPNLTYTPAANYSGADSFTFTTNDGAEDSSPGTISIQVNPANDPPTAYNQALSTDEDVDLPVMLTASDPEGDPLTYTVTVQPNNGTLSGSPPAVTYQPDANFNGADSFSFVASDGTEDSNTATISITVDPVNDAPTAGNVSDSTLQDTTDTWYPVVSDVDGEALTCTISSGPGAGASASVDPDCSSGQYTPPPGYSGLDTFAYQVCDLSAACDEAVVSYSITAVSSSLHTGDLDGGSTAAPRNRWEATIFARVHDALENPVANATVNGSWSDGVTGGGSCTTNASGECSFTKTNIKGNVASATFMVTDITHATLSYNAADNHDEEPDSDGTIITVLRDGPAVNQPPQANFTYSCTDLTCNFDGSGSTDDGSIVSYDWDYGDGQSGFGVTASNTYASASTYSVTLTVTDDEGATDSTTQQVSPGSTPAQFLHVAALLDSYSIPRKNRWDAEVRISIHTDGESLFEGATVSGVWSTGREMSCTTNSIGECTVTLANLKTAVESVGFTVTDVAATGWSYDAAANHVTAVTVFGPLAPP